MDILNELMTFNSFWSLWFWIVHVVAWSMASHFTLGVPFDMVMEANREKSEDGPWSRATEAIILAQVFRFSEYARRYGALLAGVAAFILSVCVTMGTLGNMEFARAMFTIFLPMTLIYILGIRCARRIEAEGLRGRELRQRIRSQRLVNQLVGLLGISMAVTFAIYQALLNRNVWMFDL